MYCELEDLTCPVLGQKTTQLLEVSKVCVCVCTRFCVVHFFFFFFVACLAVKILALSITTTAFTIVHCFSEHTQFLISHEQFLFCF